MPTIEEVQAANQQEFENLRDCIRSKDELITRQAERIDQLQDQITDYQDKLDKVVEVIKSAKVIR